MAGAPAWTRFDAWETGLGAAVVDQAGLILAAGAPNGCGAVVVVVVVVVGPGVVVVGAPPTWVPGAQEPGGRQRELVTWPTELV